jgi:hypothetical protein
VGVVAAGTRRGNAWASLATLSGGRMTQEAGITVRFTGRITGQLSGRSIGPAVFAFGLLAVASLAHPVSAYAARATDAFTIANYPVEATDKDAVAAKDKALAEGQKAAFRSLLKRIVPVTAYKQISRLSNVKAADLIAGTSVRSERNSATEYIASLDFSFQADAVRAALQREGVPFVERQAEAITVVPVLRQGNPSESKSDTGAWRAAWSGLDLVHTLTPVKLDDLKPVIHSDTVKMLADGDDNGLRILTSEYGTDRIVLAIFETDISAKKVLVTLAGQDAVGTFLLKRTYRMSGGDLGYTSELAAVVALGVLEGRWKATKGSANSGQSAAVAPAAPAWSAGAATAPAAAGDSVSFVAEFTSLAQWNEIRTQLLDTPGVDDLNISTISARTAEVALQFPGGPQGLSNAVGARGLSLLNNGTSWVLRPSN